MPIPFSRVLSLFLNFLRNNALARLLRRTPSILFNIIRFIFSRKSTIKLLDSDDKTALEKADDAFATSNSHDHEAHATICASRVPDLHHPYLHHPSDSLSSSADITIQVESPVESPVDTSSGRHRLSLGYASHRSRSSLSVHSQGLTSIRSQARRSNVSLGALAAPRALSPSQSLLSLHSIANTETSVLTFNGERASIRPSLIHEDIDCMLSIELSRYLRKHTIPQTTPNVTLPAMETRYASKIPPGWTKYIHPDGAPYWYDEHKKVLTDVDLLNDELLSETHRFLDIIFDYIRAENIQLEPDVELVVEVVKYDDDDHYRCGYYFAHHKSRCLFWLQPFDVSHALWDAQGQTSLSHVKLEIEVSYWQHWEFFCNIQAVTEDILNEMTDMLITSLVDLQTSETSNALFSVNELQSYLGAVKISRRLIGSPCRGSPWFIGRLMTLYMRQRFANFYGEYGARLHREQSVHHPNGRSRSLLITVVSPFLFNAPDIHLRALHLIFIDDTASTQPWRGFIKKLNEEWQDFTINAAVLLAANVAFLAIQSVDNNAGSPERSPSQIASYLSTLTSVSSIMVGMLLVRQNRTKGHDTAKAAADYLRKRQYRIVGHEPLAIMYSLPYAFLMWSILFFLIAFVLVCILNTTLVTRLCSGITAFLCVGLIVWCIWMNWDRVDPQEHESKWNLSIDFLVDWRQRLRESLQRSGLPFIGKEPIHEETQIPY